jgi:hypothetical protein
LKHVGEAAMDKAGDAAHLAGGKLGGVKDVLADAGAKVVDKAKDLTKS